MIKARNRYLFSTLKRNLNQITALKQNFGHPQLGQKLSNILCVGSKAL